MPILHSLLEGGTPIKASADVARMIVTPETWREAAQALAGGKCAMMSLWASAGHVHMALHEGDAGQPAILSLPCPDGAFPSVGRLHPPAIRLERTICDLFGLLARDAPDTRPWLDHGRWGLRHPLRQGEPGAEPADAAEAAEYEFCPIEGEGLHRIPVGPVHAGIIEPGHFRFTQYGETVVRLEERLGYTHKGVDALMQGADLARGVQLAGRVSGDSTVAYAWAFSLAAETALGQSAPARATWLRALMAELERLANHLGDIGAICNDAAFAIMHAHCGALRERVLRACDAAFGERMMRDLVVPGGVACDLGSEGITALRALVARIESEFPGLVDLYDSTPSVQNRTCGAGIVAPELVRQFATGGFIGRAAGRGFDARRQMAHAPYDSLSFEVPVQQGGDVNARIWQRIHEVVQSLALVRQILDRLPEGPHLAELPAPEAPAEALTLIEGFRGDILVWLALDEAGRIHHCHLRDPSWFQWPLLEVAIKDNIVADFPLCNKSFNCSYSGVDL